MSSESPAGPQMPMHGEQGAYGADGAHFAPDGTPLSPWLRRADWSRSPLGAPAGWPRALRGAVTLLLDSPTPMWLAWGPGLALVCNEPFARWLGDPAAAPPLGLALPEVAAAAWPALEAQIAPVLEGRPLRCDELPWPLSRDRAATSASCAPLRDDDGRVAGLVCTLWADAPAGLARRLAESEARFEGAQATHRLFAAIVESTDAMVQAVDLQGRWLALNRAARSGLAPLYGGEPRIGGSVFDVVDLHAAAGWLAAWRSALAGDAAERVLALGTPPRSYDLRFSTLADDAGRPLVVYQFAIDITERLDARRRLGRAEAALRDARQRETEERYRLAVLATTDAVWDWRLADGHVVWNRALEALFGHALETSSADWWLEHIHPEDRPRIAAGIHAVIDGRGSAWNDEYRFLRADGRYADVLDRGTVLRDDEGRALRMIGAMLDLSERKAAEAALRESERQFRALFELIDEGFCVIEFLDGPHGPMSDYVHVLANPAYTANAGIPDVVGQRVRDMVPQEAAAWVEVYRNVLLTGEPLRFERELVATGRYLELAAFRIEPPQRRQVAVLFQDVTARHRAEIALRELNDTLERRVAEEVAVRTRTEEALRQSQKMEAVGQLTGGIAHDFNNMLAVIIGSLDLLGRRFVDGDARARRHVEAAREGARRAALLTQRLLAFSRQQPLKPAPVDVNKLVAGMSDLLRHSLGGAVRLEAVLAGGLWRTHADPNQLENVILNLAVNGRDAMGDGGRLTIETANAHLDERYAAEHIGLSAGQYVMVAVTDTGTGMAPEVVTRAFDPFFTTKEVGRGTGLGLSQVYGFVKQSGGHVKIYSEVGQGTTVKVYLPRLTAPFAETAEPAASCELPLGDRREVVLVVEDEPAVRQFSVDALTELGYQVLEADGAEAALRLLDQHPEIALLFTDVVMPEVNGRRLADEARRRRPGLKVLFTTGYTRNAVVHNGVLDAGVHLIGKPFTLEELAARVREVLDLPPAVTPSPET